MSDETPDAVEFADDLSALLYGIAGWLSIGFGLLAAIAAAAALLGGEAAAVIGILFLVSFAFVALGAFVTPRFRRRVDRRHALSRFGRIRSVDRRTIRPDEETSEQCVSCRSEIDQGMVSRYREEYAIAGVPVYTASEGYNHYCLECASAEVLAGESDDPLEQSSNTIDETADPTSESVDDIDDSEQSTDDHLVERD
ncbi:hypothetical protein ACLI4Z_11445 [Natrialbaceae archaeon A-arb3/5]